MDWVRLDVDFFDHPKILGLTDRAKILYLQGLLYCAYHETDWVVPLAWCSKIRARDLIEAGLWKQTDGGWKIHNADWRQPGLERLKEIRAKRSSAGKLGASKRYGKPLANAMANGEQKPWQTDSTVTVTPTVRSTGLSTTFTLGERNGQTGTGTSAGEGTIPAAQLINAMTRAIADICSAENRKLVQREAAAVALWAVQHVDRRVIEESVGWLAGQEHPPVLPRAVAAVIVKKAQDNHIVLTAFNPDTVKPDWLEPKPPPPDVAYGTDFAPGTGKIPNWSKGER